MKYASHHYDILQLRLYVPIYMNQSKKNDAEKFVYLADFY